MSCDPGLAYVDPCRLDDKGSIVTLTMTPLAAVVNRVTCSAPVPGSTLYVHACHPRGALPAPGLAGCSVGRGE